MKKFLSLIVVLLSGITMFAQPRSEQQAKQIASEFFKKKPQRKAPMLSVVPQQKVSQTITRRMARAKAAPAQRSGCYIINDEANNRFVIVSADERMYDILGYSENGAFNADSLPQGLMDILYGYDEQYEYLQKNADPSHNYKAKRRAAKVVEPLITTKWDQDSPYNIQCPDEKVFGIVDMKTMTGCVATAMAQVMNYHKYPARGQGSTSYTTVTNIQQSMDFSSVSFDWQSMTDTYDDASTEIEKDAVAELMHACGVSVHMTYSWLGSEATAQDLAYALIHYFKYNPNIKYYERRYFSKEAWDDIIQEDLVNGRPILYSGLGERTDSEGKTYKYGHEFVLDGCNSEGKYHFNFGWSGEYDGYYELTAITPKENRDYTLDQAMVCNVSPQTIGKHEDIFFATAVLYDKYEFNAGSSVTATFDPHCAVVESNSYGTLFKGEFGIGVFDMNKNFVKSLYKKSGNDMSTGTYYESLNAYLYFDRTTFANGSTYYIAPYAKASSSTDYTWMRTTYGLWDYYIATVSDGIVKLSSEPLPIPIGTVYASAFDASNKKVEWKFTLNQAPDDNRIYWFDGIDPALSGNDNRVWGKLDDSGTQIRIKIGQPVGNGLTITNYSSNDDIVVSVSAKDSVMSIGGAWGVLKMNENGDNVTQETYSQYSLTEMTFKYVPVETPMIIFNKADTLVSIVCSTEGADIYYTLDGTTPNASSALYTSPIAVSGNCTIKAVAEKTGKKSSVAVEEIKWFTVEKPIITVDDGSIVTITCPTEGAVIYYTTDKTSPASSSTRLRYEEPITVTEGCYVKAIAEKDNYNNSELAEKFVPGPDPIDYLVINDNEAGKLEESVGESRKTTTSKMKVSGNLNGSDIKFIREMINSNSLKILDIANCNIVSGGEPYYKTNYSEYNTEDGIIGNSMFYQCKNLTSITLPQSARKIEMYAICGCDGLTELSIPCPVVEDLAIQNCKNLERVQLGDAVEKFDGGNLTGCPVLSTITVHENNTKFVADDGVLYSNDKKTLVKYPMGKSSLSYVIPNSVTSIGKNAFSYSSVEDIVLPESLKTIGSSAFTNCKTLKGINLPNSLNKIGYMAFWGCRSIMSITIPSEMSEIESYLFYDCVNLRECSIGRSVTTIASDAFTNCTTLQKYYVDEENPKYTAKNGVLYSKDMSSLVRCPLAYYTEEFRVPDGISVIRSGALDGCKNIGKVVLPESVTEIGSSAFIDCSMSSINLPNSISSIGNMAFWGCKALESITLPKKLEVIDDNLLYNCSGLKYLFIPANVKSIGSDAFYGCKNITVIESKITDVESVDVDFSSYLNAYSPFRSIPDTCTWQVPIGPKDAVDKYAKKYGAQPWWVSTWRIVPPVVGDINGDEKVDIADAVSVLNLMAESKYTEDADINKDNKVDIADFVSILNIMAE